MRSFDFINGAFELVGSCFVWKNVFATIKDKGYAGLYLPSIIFFWAWGLWNIAYYPSLNQWLSFGGGLFVTLANTTWIALMIHYGKKE
jgi:hypothetical protein